MEDIKWYYLTVKFYPGGLSFAYKSPVPVYPGCYVTVAVRDRITACEVLECKTLEQDLAIEQIVGVVIHPELFFDTSMFREIESKIGRSVEGAIRRFELD